MNSCDMRIHVRESFYLKLSVKVEMPCNYADTLFKFLLQIFRWMCASQRVNKEKLRGPSEETRVTRVQAALGRRYTHNL